MKRELRLFDELDQFAAGGEVPHAMALSYGYDGDVANERLWRPLVEKFGVRHPLVIADGVVNEGTAIGVHVLRATRKSGLFHPKLLLAVREDAVLAAIGSANLTRGGLGGNLEFVTSLVFGRDIDRSPPRAALDAILAFVGDHVLKGLEGRIAESSIDIARDILRHARLVADTLPDRSRGAPLHFLHNYGEPLWPQLRRLHGEDPIERLIVLSPFFEDDDPDLDESGSLLLHALSDGLPWATRARAPRCSLYVSPVESGLRLPLSALAKLGAHVEVCPQLASTEPRRLHAKLLALVGRKRTTMLWGSPNFSPAAFLRAAGAGGNVECAIATSILKTSADPAELLDELDLSQVFAPHRGEFPASVPPLPKREPLVFEVGEALYDPQARWLTICGELFASSASWLRASALAEEGSSPLLDALSSRTGPFQLSGPCHTLEEQDVETGKRRLRTMHILVEALDVKETVIATQKVRLNVRFDDALELRQNLLLGPEALSADALLVPSSAPPEQRVAAIDAQIERWKAARRSDRLIVPSHHASLDAFYRNVRLGLDARLRGLEQRRGSRFSLLRWSHDLRRSLRAALGPPMDAPRRLYLVARVAEHIERVLMSVPRWHTSPDPAYAVIEPMKLIEALSAVPIEDRLHPEIVEEVRTARARVVIAVERLC